MSLKSVNFTGFLDQNELYNYLKTTTIFVALDIGIQLNMHEALLNHIPCVVSEETEVSPALQASGYVMKTKSYPEQVTKQKK